MSRPALAVAAAVLLVVAGVLYGSPAHPHFWWERIPAYGGLIGFAGGLALVGLAKGVLARLSEPDEEDGAERGGSEGI